MFKSVQALFGSRKTLLMEAFCITKQKLLVFDSLFIYKKQNNSKKTLLKFNTKSYPTMEFYESVKNNPTGSIKALIKFSKYLQ